MRAFVNTLAYIFNIFCLLCRVCPGIFAIFPILTEEKASATKDASGAKNKKRLKKKLLETSKHTRGTTQIAHNATLGSDKP